MTTQAISITIEEYKLSKKKEVIVENVLLQLDASLNALEKGKVKRVR